MPLHILFSKNTIYNKKIKKDYDIEIAFLEGPITRLFSIKNENTKKISWIHNDISLVFGNGIKSKIKRHIDKKIYSKYKTLVFVSNDNLDKFNKQYKDLNVNKKVIYNYINKDNIIKKAEQKQDIKFNNNKINFLTVARLVPQKAIDRLIKIHSKLIKSGFQHYFYVIGDGSEKEKLENLIKEKEVENTFKLLGKIENPYPYIKNCHYFCLLSKFEGYGMVLEEAKILNKPIIITNTAAREAINNYQNSYIIENTEEEIYTRLKEILEKENTKIENTKFVYDNKNIIQEIIKMIGE